MAQLPPMDLFGALLFQVAGQQLSVAATRRTLARIQAMFGGHLPAPADLLSVDPDQLRAAGLSWRKVSTLRDLAGRMSDGRLNPDALSRLPDEELMTELTAIPGIGPWTMQGALIVALQREDVGSITFPYSRRSWPSPRSGGLIAAWRPATCSPPTADITISMVEVAAIRGPAALAWANFPVSHPVSRGFGPRCRDRSGGALDGGGWARGGQCDFHCGAGPHIFMIPKDLVRLAVPNP